MITPVTSVAHNGQYDVIQTSTGLVLNSDNLVYTLALPAMVHIQGLLALLGKCVAGAEDLSADRTTG